MPTKIDNLHKIYKGKIVAKSEQELIYNGICPECGGRLKKGRNKPDDGDECLGCGATFTGGA
jgi:ssDNA-binding Zn-finger/Zn-ribbon topoisomerase 1